MNKILDVVEDIKQNITDNQYKIIMDSLMKIHKIEVKQINDKIFEYYNNFRIALFVFITQH